MGLRVSFRLIEASGSSSARYHSFYCNINFYHELKIIFKHDVSSSVECLLLCRRTQQFYRKERRHLLDHPVNASVLRDMIKGIHCLMLHKKGHVEINKHLKIPVSLIR